MTVAHAEIVQTCINGDVMMDIASIKENIVMEYQIARMAVTRNQVTTTFVLCIYYDWYFEPRIFIKLVITDAFCFSSFANVEGSRYHYGCNWHRHMCILLLSMFHWTGKSMKS